MPPALPAAGRAGPGPAMPATTAATTSPAAATTRPAVRRSPNRAFHTAVDRRALPVTGRRGQQRPAELVIAAATSAPPAAIAAPRCPRLRRRLGRARPAPPQPAARGAEQHGHHHAERSIRPRTVLSRPARVQLGQPRPELGRLRAATAGDTARSASCTSTPVPTEIDDEARVALDQAAMRQPAVPTAARRNAGVADERRHRRRRHRPHREQISPRTRRPAHRPCAARPPHALRRRRARTPAAR